MDEKDLIAISVSLAAFFLAFLTFVLNAYYRTFRPPSIMIVFGDLMSFSYTPDHKLRITNDITLLNDGAQYAVVIKLCGCLIGPDQQKHDVKWRSFVESKDLGQGLEFKPFIAFSSWVKPLLVPGLGAITQNINFAVANEMPLSPGKYELMIIALGGRAGRQLGRTRLRLEITEAEAAFLSEKAVAAEDGITPELLIAHREVETTWFRRHRLVS